jgi:hypothetical protein
MMKVSVEAGKETNMTLMSEMVDFSELAVIVDFGEMKVSMSLYGAVTVYKSGHPVCHLWMDEEGNFKERLDAGTKNEYQSLAMKAAITARPMVKALDDLRKGVYRMRRLAKEERDK